MHMLFYSAWPVMPTNLFPYGFEYVGQYSPENVNYLSHIQYNGRHSQTQESSSQENLQTGSNEQSGEENEQTSKIMKIWKNTLSVEKT